MELRHLAYFVAITDEGGFTRAAERLHVAQPAVSQQIARLEAELGEALFVRERGVQLTDAGRALLPHARAALAAADRGRAAIAELRGLLTGRLALGLVQPLPDRRALATVGAFGRTHPTLDVTLQEGETPDLVAELAAGNLDVALLGYGRDEPIPANLEHRPVMTEPVVVLVEPSHRLARRRRIRLADLEDEPLVSLSHGHRLRALTETACRDHGFRANIVADSSDLGVVVDLAAEGVGAAIVPASAVHAEFTAVSLTLHPPILERKIILAWRTAPSPAAREFLALADDHMPTRSSG